MPTSVYHTHTNPTRRNMKNILRENFSFTATRITANLIKSRKLKRADRFGHLPT